MKIHMVKKGDTLHGIAKKNGVTVEELLQLNPGIANPDAIDVGMKIKVPAPKAPGGDWVHQHKVVQGDTLWKLSKAWGIPLADMIKANPQLKNPNVLMTGEIVNIPKSAGAASDGSGHAGHGGQIEQVNPADFPGLTELQHIDGEQPVPGKAFTGKKPTAPMPQPQPTPIEPEAVSPTPAPEPPPVPLPTPVEPPKAEIPKPAAPPVPLPTPVAPPKGGYGVPAKPAIPAVPEQVLDLFKQFNVPAVEAGAPHAAPSAYPAMPPAPMFGAEAGVGGYPMPGPMMPAEQPHYGNPCPPGMMPLEQLPHHYGNPCPPGMMPLGAWAEAGPGPGQGAYAAAGPGVFAGVGMGMPGVQGVPGMPEMPGMYGYGAPAGEPYGHGPAHVHGWPGAVQAAEWPGAPGGYGVPHLQSPYSAGYGMPQHAAGIPHGGMMPMAYPAAAGGCSCGCHQRQASDDAAAIAGQAAEAADLQSAGRKDGKKAAARTRSGGRARLSGSANAAHKPKPAQKRGSRPWINR